LEGYFRGAAKPRDRLVDRLEQEKIGVLADGGRSPTTVRPASRQILEGLVARGSRGQDEDGHIISLERGAERITIEPERATGARGRGAGNRQRLS